MRRYRARTLAPWAEYVVAAASVSFAVWLFFVIGPLIMEGLAR